jgi:hypothetical protein
VKKVYGGIYNMWPVIDGMMEAFIRYVKRFMEVAYDRWYDGGLYKVCEKSLWRYI